MALCTPTNAPPPRTQASSAAFCASSIGNSPVVKKTTASYSARVSAVRVEASRETVRSRRPDSAAMRVKTVSEVRQDGMREGGRLREVEHLRGLRRGRRRAGEEREGGCCHGYELNCVSHGPHPFAVGVMPCPSWYRVSRQSGRRGAGSRGAARRRVPSAMRSRLTASWHGPISRRDDAEGRLSPSRCFSPAGASPASVGAGAPSGRRRGVLAARGMSHGARDRLPGPHASGPGRPPGYPRGRWRCWGWMSGPAGRAR